MQVNNDPNWLTRMVEIETNCDSFAVGGTEPRDMVGTEVKPGDTVWVPCRVHSLEEGYALLETPNDSTLVLSPKQFVVQLTKCVEGGAHVPCPRGDGTYVCSECGREL